MTGEIELWIELGQPDEQRIRKACGRARQVVVIGYSGRGDAACHLFSVGAKVCAATRG